MLQAVINVIKDMLKNVKNELIYLVIYICKCIHIDKDCFNQSSLGQFHGPFYRFCFTESNIIYVGVHTFSVNHVYTCKYRQFMPKT